MKKAHFIGVCGVGMSATAKLLKESGWEVSGSDDAFYPPGSELVARYGISFTKGYRAENIPKDAELIVIGKNAKLVPEENAEVKAAFESGKPVRSFPEVLEQFVDDKQTIVVAGSYAKSTATGLLAWCLMRAGTPSRPDSSGYSGGDPSYFLGAIPIESSMNTAHLGKGDLFVLEGDEYPSSNWDDTSKFLYYHPHDVLLTSASHDHVNVFPTHEEYLVPFKTLLSLIPKNGLLVANADESFSLALARTHTGKTLLYGLSNPEASFHANNIVYGPTTTFTLAKDGEAVTELSTTLLGKHNVQNLVGVSALLLERELVTPEVFRESVKTFTGIRRRLELLSPLSTVRVYEGFGSSYEKARAAFDAMKLHFPKERLITVFEPHTFSWRNRDTLSWYDDAFRESDLVLVYEPAIQGAHTHKQLSQKEIVKLIEKSGVKALPIHSEEEGLRALERELSSGDVVLLMTSGNLGGLIDTLPQWAEKKFPV